MTPPKPRECMIFWNGLSRQGEWQVSGLHDLDIDGLTFAVPFIEKSAYDAVVKERDAMKQANEKLRLGLLGIIERDSFLREPNISEWATKILAEADELEGKRE